MRSAGVGGQGKLQSVERESLTLVRPWAWSGFSACFFMSPVASPATPQRPLTPQKHAVDPNQPTAALSRRDLPPRREKIWTDFDGRQALAEAKMLTDFGPRPSGSDANKQVRQHLIDRLTKSRLANN